MSDLDFTLLDEYAQQLNRRDAARTSTALGLGNTQPNAAAEALEIARNLGVPPMAVVAQPDRFRADFQRFTNTNTLIDAPITRGWVDHDAMNAALAQDDLANLSGFERTVAEIALSVEGVGDVLEDTQAGRGVQTGISGAGQMATAVGTIPVSSMLQRDFQVLDYLGQLQDADPNLARHEVASLLGIDANSTAAAIAYDFLRGDEDRRQNHIDRVTSRVMANEETMTALVDAVNAYSAQMQETQGRMPNFTDIRDVGDFADWLSFNTGQAIPYMAATVLAGAIGGVPGVIGAGYGMGVGDIQSGLIEEGITDQGGIALAGGIPYAGLELLGPAARPFRGVGGDVLQEVAQGYLRRLGREFGENAVEEFINEAGQEIIRDYAVQAGGGEEVILNNETLLRWFNAGMAGAGAGGMMAAVSTSPVQREIERADDAGGTAAALDQVDAAVAASQLRGRAPDRFLDFANQTGAGQQLLYVPADGLREYAQARDMTDEDLEAWGVDVESLDQLAPSGGVVSVPMSNYAAMISGTDGAAWFRENATRREDEMSLAEAAAFNDQVQEVMQEAFDEVERQRLSDEELRASDVQIYDQVFSQLRAAGRSPDVAQNEARVWSAFWVTMGERYGEDPLDLARSMGVRIQGAMTPEIARRRNQTDVLLNELRRRGDAALRPRGMSILDFVMSEGGVMDPGGEVAMLEGPAGLISESRDQIAERQGQPNMLGLPSESRGTTMEDMARRVAEAGYWPDLMGVVTEGNPDTEVDLTQRLLDALSGELAGERVYLDGEGPDANLTQLSEALSARGIDLADVTNDEAIAALEAERGGREYDQSAAGDPRLLEANFAEMEQRTFATGRELKEWLQERALQRQQEAGIDLTTRILSDTPQDVVDAIVAHLGPLLEEDARYAFQDNAGAIGWYDRTVTEALNVAGMVYPEINTDPNARMRFIWALAVTSNGIKVDKNFDYAAQAYDGYKQAGRFPQIDAGEASKAINHHLQLYHDLSEAWGDDNLRRFMMTPMTVSELKRLTGIDVSGENSNTVVRGAAILGAKIGNGFYSNLNGVFDALTIDRWNMRTMGRLRGTLIEVRPEAIAGAEARLQATVDSMTPAQVDHLRGFFNGKSQIDPAAIGPGMTSDRLQAFANEIKKRSASPEWRDHIANRGKGRNWAGDEIRKAGNSLWNWMDGQVEIASNGSERNMIRAAHQVALENLQADPDLGLQSLNMSDLQALLWYPEKRLYDAAKQKEGAERGYEDDDAPDYANAARKWAERRGVSAGDRSSSGYARPGYDAEGEASVENGGRGFSEQEWRDFRRRAGIRSLVGGGDPTSPRAVSGLVTRKSLGDGASVRGLSVLQKLTAPRNRKFGKWMSDLGVALPPLYELDASTEAQAFADAITASKAETPYGAAVYVYPVEEYAEMRLYMTEDGGAGFAVKSDGDIVSVFGVSPKGTVDWLMQAAIDQGGRKLDAFDTVLPSLYSRHGFKVVERLQWDDQYAPDNWDYDTFAEFNSGRPDVVFMQFDENYYGMGDELRPQGQRTLYQSGTHPFEGVTRDEFLGSPRITSNANAASLVPRVLPAVDAVEAVPFDSGVGLTAKYHEDGAAVLKDGKVIASYNFGDTLVVAKGYRRKGIGEELVYQWRMRFPQSKPATSRTKSSQRLQEKVWDRIQREIAGAAGHVRSAKNVGSGSVPALDVVVSAINGEVISRRYDDSGFGDTAVIRASETDLQISVREDETGIYLTNIASKQAGDLTATVAGSGVGSAAMRALMSYADRTGKPFAVAGATEPARGFYERMGMVPADVTVFMDDGYLTSPASGEGGGGFVYRPWVRTYNQGEETRRGSIVLPSGGVTEGQTIINLFEGADLSTVLHESGHFFYEAFEALASQDSAPQAMKADLETLQAWMGVKPGERPTVEAHERMARGFERYLMEGKSPSIELASAFSRFKAWLTRIYRQVAGLNVNLTDEVREVFDRMLATDAAIDEAKAEASMRPLFREAPAGMTDADFRAYQRLGQKAEARAEQNLLERTMEKVRRRKEAWWKEERKATEAEVTESVNRRRAHRLVELLANGQWLGAQEGQDVPDMRIDRAQLVEVFGEGVLQEISRTQVGGKRAIYGDDGASPGEVAEFFGYENAMEMIEELQNTGKRKEVIKSETDRLMEERHGDPLNDGSIEAEAMDAVHSIQQGETIAAEARQLAKQRGQDGSRVNNRVFRYRAQQMISRMSVRDASRPQTFLAAERKAARVAERAFAKVARGGRGAEQALAEAYQAKEQQLLNHHLYMEAREVERLVERGRERMRNYDKDKVRKKLEGGYIEQIDALLDRFDFRRRSPGQVNRSESLRDFMDRMIEEGREAELMIPPDLADESRRTHYSRMSVEELRGLFDAVANLDHMGRFKQKLIDRQKARDLAESAGTVADQIRDNFGTGRAKKESRVRNTFNLLWTADTMLVEMDGLDEFGPAYRQIKEDIDAGQAEEQRLSVELAERLDQLFSVYTAKELREMQTARVRDGVNAKAWSKLEILAAALNTGNADNMQRLLADDAHPDVRMDRAQLDALLSNLDKRDWDFVQSMWDLIDGYWPQIRDVTKRRTGVAPGKVDAVPVVTPYGTYRGGYYPIKYDPGLSANANLDDRTAFDDFVSSGRHGKAQTANGHTIKRKQSGNGRTLMLDMNVAFAHMRDVVRDIALSEAVDNSYRILNYPEVVNAFIDAGRQGDHRVLNLWLKDTAKGPIYNTDTINSLARIVKNNFTLSRLAFNMKTVALQITGIGQSAATVGKKAMLRGFQEYLKRPNAMAKEVMEMSPFMAERQSTFQKDIYDFANDVKVASPLASRWANAKSAVSKAGFAPIVKVQFYAVDMPTWLAGYNVGLERFNNEAEAIQYADRMVARSQDSGLMGDRNAASRGTVSETTRQADFIRVFTTLAGYMMTKMNRGNITIRRGVKGMSEGSTSERLASAANMATDLILLYVTEAVMMALMYGLMTDEDEPEDYARFIGREIGSAVFGGIPFVRDAASAFSGFGAGGVYGSVGEIPYRVYQQVSQGENDRALRRAIGDVVGITTGLPTTASLRAIEGIVAPDEVSPAEALFGSNPLTR